MEPENVSIEFKFRYRMFVKNVFTLIVSLILKLNKILKLTYEYLINFKNIV